MTIMGRGDTLHTKRLYLRVCEDMRGSLSTHSGPTTHVRSFVPHASFMSCRIVSTNRFYNCIVCAFVHSLDLLIPFHECELKVLFLSAFIG